MKDTLTGKHTAEFHFHDKYGINVQEPDTSIDIVTAPVFSTEEDAQAALDFAFDVFMDTLRMCNEHRAAYRVNVDKQHGRF